MSNPNYLEIEEQRMDIISIEPEEIQLIRIPVVDKAEAVSIAPKYEQEFIDRGVAYKKYFHTHTHGVNIRDNASCVRVEL